MNEIIEMAIQLLQIAIGALILYRLYEMYKRIEETHAIAKRHENYIICMKNQQNQQNQQQYNPYQNQ